MTFFLTLLLMQQPMALTDFERMALANNPTIAQAAAGIRAAQGRARQAGVYPNPSAGFDGDEMSPGPTTRWGEIGFFVQQEIVTAGKLGLSRRSVEQEVVRAQAEADAQRRRVLNSVRSLFYRAMAAERRIDVRQRLGALVQEAVTISRQLMNVGQADLPDVLEAEIELQRSEIALSEARTEQETIWRKMAAVVNVPSLSVTPLAGNLEDVPALQMDPTLSTLLGDSPEIHAARADIARAELALRRAEAEKIPNVDLRSGLRNNRELLEIGGKAVGLETFFEIGVRIPIFDRNQGNVDAARAELERAQREVDRVQLSLRSRLAASFKQYTDLRSRIEKYRTEMLPRARRAYDLYLSGFRQMAAAYPQVLIAQRTLLQLQEEYDNALAGVWTRVSEIQSMLLDGGLE